MTSALSIIAIMLSAVAIAVSIWTALINNRSAVAAESSAVATDRSADAAKDSARHASRSADAAERVAHAEASRDHEMYRPQPPDMKTALAFDGQKPAEQSLSDLHRWPHISGGGDIIRGNSRSPLGLSPAIGAGEKVRVWIDDKATPADSVNIRFWPSLPEDLGEKWECPCSGPTEPDGPAVHWEWNLPVPKRRGPIVVA
jgi:hypothetical protein